MFDAPMDGLYGWVGLAIASVAVAGLAVSLPTTSPPDAATVATQVDEVATSDHRVEATIDLRADAIKIGGSQVSLRVDGATAHARFVTSTVTPADTESLEAILRGSHPSSVYPDGVAFEAAVDRASDGTGEWRPAPARLKIRRVTWGDVDATVVG